VIHPRGRRLPFRNYLALALIVFISVPCAFPQQPAPPAPAAPAAPTLTILVLQGADAINNIELHSAVVPVVEVRDMNERPIENATVTFELPATGASGFFPGQQLKYTTRTNLQGQAAAQGFVPNFERGRFRIKVTATFGNQTGSTSIYQTNASNAEAVQELSTPKKFWTWWKIAAIVGGAGAVAGILAATLGGGNGSSSSSSTVTITPGPVTIGGPR
jgi:hypothetical protein